MTEFVKFASRGAIAVITIDRPDRMNALHPAAHYELATAFDRIAADAALRVAILTGSGDRAFCAGYDLRDNLETGVIDLPPAGFGGLTRRTDIKIPLIAAVNGVALGGGFELVLACDLVIASQTASFALPEPKVGWAALSGGVQRLPGKIGMTRALGMILTARTVGADEALTLGLVNEVVAPAELMDRALALANEIAACSPLAIRCSKAIAYASLDQAGLSAAMDVDGHPDVKVLLASDDAVEGKRAFAERRPPCWTGR